MAGFRSDWQGIGDRLLARLARGEVGGIRREDVAPLEPLLQAAVRAVPSLLEQCEGMDGGESDPQDPTLAEWFRLLSRLRGRPDRRGMLIRAIRAMERAVFQESARVPAVRRRKEEIREGFLRLLLSVANLVPVGGGEPKGGPAVSTETTEGLEPRRLLGVLDSLGNPVFVLEKDLRVTWCNQAARWMFLGSRSSGEQSLLPRPAIVDVVPEIPVALAAMVQGGQAEASLERRVETRHGPRHFHLRIRRLGGLGDPEEGHVVVMTDLSRHLEMERVLRQARSRLEEKVQERTEELERLNRALLQEVRERNETEAILRESEARWRSLVELSPDGVIVIQRERVVFHNPAATRLLGDLPITDQGPSVLDLVHPDDRERMAREIAGDHRNGPERLEIRFVDRSGRVIETEVASSSVVWQKEPATQMVIRDVRERKRVLLEAEIRARAYDAILEARDRLGRGDFDSAGTEVARCLGKALGSVRVFYWVPGGPGGYTVGGFYEAFPRGPEPSRDRNGIVPEAVPWIRRAVSAGEAIWIRDCSARSGWPQDWVGEARSAIVCPVRHQDRVFGVALCLFPDQEPPSEARRRLALTVGEYLGAVLEGLWMYRRFQEAESRFRSIFENALEGMYACTPDHCLITVNPSLARILGYPDPTALMISPEDFRRRIHADPVRREAFLRELREKGQVLGFEYPARRVDGRKVWVSETAWTVRDARGEVLRYEGVIEDVSRRRDLEMQLLQSQKQEAIGRLAGGIAHDFNNLLTVMLGYLGQVLEEESLPPSVRPSLREVEQAALRAAQLTQQLLVFGRNQPIEPRAVEVNAAIRGVESLLRRLLGENIRLEIRLAETPLWVRLEGGQLDQVLINLAINSRDAMPEGGRLLIEAASRVLLEPEPGSEGATRVGACAEIRVVDTGAGMEPDVVARIFEPFFTTKRPGEGSGLGLAVVYGIVRKSGGSIHCESEPGRGTTMRIRLPLSEPNGEADAGGAVVPTARGPGRARVLVVEDEEALREAIRVTLDHSGYRTFVAPDGATARRMIEEGTVVPDVLVCDLVMPGEGGRELARALRRVWPRLPVLFISGYGCPEGSRDPLDFREFGESWAFLPKPFQRGHLLSRIGALLGGRCEESATS